MSLREESKHVLNCVSVCQAKQRAKLAELSSTLQSYQAEAWARGGHSTTLWATRRGKRHHWKAASYPQKGREDGLGDPV